MEIIIRILDFDFVCVYCDGRSKRQTQWVWRQASERLLFNKNNKIKVSKGD